MQKITYEATSLFHKKPMVITSWRVEAEDCDSASKLNGSPRECEGVRDPETGHVCDDCRLCADYAYRKDYGDDEEATE